MFTGELSVIKLSHMKLSDIEQLDYKTIYSKIQVFDNKFNSFVKTIDLILIL